MAVKDLLSAWRRRVPGPLRPVLRASELWSSAGGMRMSAAVSFYGILSLAPLLLAIVAVFGWWFDRGMLQSGLVEQIGSVIGPRASALIEETLRSAQEPSEGIAASVVGLGVLLFAATGVFGELQQAFELVWAEDRGVPEKPGLWDMAKLRLRGLGYILALGFLLLASLAVTAMLSMVSQWAGQWLPARAVMLAANELAAFAIAAALFAGLMRLSTGQKPGTRYLVYGALLGAALFTVGRHLMTLYLANAAAVSAYGAAGSLIVLLMWIYFSSAVLLLGAGYARAFEDRAQEKREEAQRMAAARTAAGARAGEVTGP